MKLEIKDVHVTIQDKEILKGVSLTINQGEVVALMGPNGSGKSTLANVIMGHPDYKITNGSITYNNKDLQAVTPEERSQLGLFLSFQQPMEIPGLIVHEYLREITQVARKERIPIMKFRKELKEHMRRLGMAESFMNRYVNQGFSGGEKKRMEILQMSLLQPTMAVLDETDSGLDIDALKSVAAGITTLKNDKLGILIITHYKRMLEYVKPDRIVIIKEGKVVHEGGVELVDQLELSGYEAVQK